MALGHWAARSPSPPSDAPIGVDSLVLALRARFDPRAAHGLRAGYELRLGEDRFRIAVETPRSTSPAGAPIDADATIDTDPGTLAAVLWNDRSLADAERAGTLTIEGDEAAAERFVRLFPMPEPAAQR